MSDTSDLQIDASGTNATDGSATITPSGDLLGVYDVIVYVSRDSSDSDSNTDPDSQDAAVYISPSAPTSLSVTTPGVTEGGKTALNNNFTFHVEGVVDGCTVAIYADGNTTPIGTAVATGDTADVQTTVQPVGRLSHLLRQANLFLR